MGQNRRKRAQEKTQETDVDVETHIATLRNLKRKSKQQQSNKERKQMECQKEGKSKMYKIKERIKKMLDILINDARRLRASITLAFLAGRRPLLIKGFVAGLVFVSPLEACSTSLYRQNIQVKALCGQQFCPSELCRCCLQQQSFTVSLWRAIYNLGNHPHKIPWAKNSVGRDPFPVLEVLFGGKRSPAGRTISIICQFYLDCFHLSVYFRKLLLYKVYMEILPLKWVVLPIVPNLVPLTSPLPWFLLSQSLPHPSIIIYSISSS